MDKPKTIPRLLIVSGKVFDLRWLRESDLVSTYHTEVVATGIEALRVLRQRDFDVVLTAPETAVSEDVALYDEIRLLRPAVRIIVLAPEASDEDILSALRAHVFACFTPPYDVNKFLSMLDRAITETDWKDGIEILSATPNWIKLRVASRKLTAERVVQSIEELKLDLPRQERGGLITAFREILLNAMEHGAGFDPEVVVEISIIRTAEAVFYHFRDPGAGFSRKDIPHAAIANPPDNPIAHSAVRELHGMRPGGFGILLAKKLVDELIYNEQGNEVLLIKQTGRRQA